MRVDLSKQLIHLTRGTMADAEVIFRSVVNKRSSFRSDNAVDLAQGAQCVPARLRSMCSLKCFAVQAEISDIGHSV